MFHFTTLKSKSHIGKRVTANGSSGTNFSTGTANNTTVNDAADFAKLLATVPSGQCFVYGVTGRQTVNLAGAEQIQKQNLQNVFPRNNETFSWSKQPGIMFIDCDIKGTTEEELRSAVEKAIPAIAAAPKVVMASSSSGIYDSSDPNSTPTTGGLHLYIFVEDASTIPKIGKLLDERLWLHGFGHHTLSNSKTCVQALKRNLIDTSVWQQSRCDYVAAPIVTLPLKRNSPTPTVYCNDGKMLSYSDCKPLTAAEQATFTQLVKDSKAAAKKKAGIVNHERIKKLPKEKQAAAKANLKALNSNRLPHDHVLHLTALSTVTVGEIMSNPSIWHGVDFCNALEPDYRDYAVNSKLYVNAESVVLHSFAHGAQVYFLESAPTKLEEAKAAGALFEQTNLEFEAAYCSALKVEGKAIGDVESLHTINCATIEDAKHKVLDSLKAGRSSSTQARLGSGKTKHIISPIVHMMKRDGIPGLIINHRKSLSAQIAKYMDVALYDNHYHSSFDDLIVTTINSLANQTAAVSAACCERGIVIIDEARSFAEELFGAGGTLTGEWRAKTIETLEMMVNAGVRFALFDAHNNGAVEVLKRFLRIEDNFKCDEQRFALPELEIYPAQYVKTGEKHVTQSDPLVADMLVKIQAGKLISVATDSSKKATALAQLLTSHAAKPVMLVTAETTNDASVQAFLSSPDTEIHKYSAVLYSPSLSCGFSSLTPVHSYALFQSGVLSALDSDQIIRRFRNTVCNKIKIAFSYRALNTQFHSTNDDDNTHALSVDDFNPSTVDLVREGAIAIYSQELTHQQQPYINTLSHWLAYGYQLRFIFSTDCTNNSAMKSIKAAQLEVKVKAVHAAESVDESELLARSLEPGIHIVKRRHEIETELQIGRDDVTPELIEKCETTSLLAQVAIHKQLNEFRNGKDFSVIDKAAKYYPDKRRLHIGLAIADYVIGRCLGDDGALRFSAPDAAEMVATAREMAGATGSGVKAIIDGVPRFLRKFQGKKAQSDSCVNWVKSLLNMYGYGQQGRLKMGLYSFTLDGDVMRFSNPFYEPFALNRNCIALFAETPTPCGLQTTIKPSIREQIIKQGC